MPVTKISDHMRQRGHLLLTAFVLTLNVLCFPLCFLAIHSLDTLGGRHLLNLGSLVYVFSYPGLTRFTTSRIYVFRGFWRSFTPPSPPPRSVPCFPSLGSSPPHGTTVSLGRPVLWMWQRVTRCRDPISRVFSPISKITSQVPRALSPRHSPHPFPFPFLFPPLSLSSPPSRSRPCSRTHFPLPPLRPNSSLGTISSNRRRVWQPKLVATGKRHFLSTDIMPRAE